MVYVGSEQTAKRFHNIAQGKRSAALGQNTCDQMNPERVRHPVQSLQGWGGNGGNRNPGLRFAATLTLGYVVRRFQRQKIKE